jgi:hypothetical protein
MQSHIDFATYGLKVDELVGDTSDIATIHVRDIEVSGGFTVDTMNSLSLFTDDLLVGSYSLAAQQQKIEQLYEALWYCLRVSESCANAPQVM